MKTQPNSNFTNLENISFIGSGRYGRVYCVRSTHFNTDFAMKVISKHDHTSDSMFMNEVGIILSMYHPNIIKIYDFYQTSSSYNLLLQYCSRGSLKKQVKKYGTFNKDKFVKVFFQVLHAIAYAHNANIAHRDLKPENILVDQYGRIQVADWGHAIQLNGNEITNSFGGTLSYSSPECVSKQPYNAFKSDMYSLGVVMYYTVIGAVPWTGQSPCETKKQICENYFLIPPYVDEDIADIIRSLMNINPNKRPSAQELLHNPLFC